jgi:hypothetical protein
MGHTASIILLVPNPLNHNVRIIEPPVETGGFNHSKTVGQITTKSISSQKPMLHNHYMIDNAGTHCQYHFVGYLRHMASKQYREESHDLQVK